MVNTMTVTPTEAADVIDALWDTGLAFCLWGGPGQGKSTTYHNVARRRNAKVQVETPATRMSTDYTGLPYVDLDRGATRYLRPEFLPIEPGPGVLGIDELGGTDEQTRTALYSLILERKIGSYHLPDGWVIVASSNRPEDGAIACDFGSAMNDRLVHLQVEVTSEGWIEWGMANNVHPAVLAYIRTRPDRLNATAEQRQSESIILPSPRSWERVSHVIKAMSRNTRRLSLATKIAVCGIVGVDVGAEFFAIAEDVVRLPDIDLLIASAGTREIARLFPKSIDTMYALCYAVAAAMTKENASRIFQIVNDIADVGPDEVPCGEISALAGQLASERVNALQLHHIGNDPAFLAYNRRFAA